MTLTRAVAGKILLDEFVEFDRQEMPESNFLVFGLQVLPVADDRIAQIGFATIAGATGFVRVGSLKFDLRML